jgi:phosphohistidine swiveling domain-containing protein
MIYFFRYFFFCALVVQVTLLQAQTYTAPATFSFTHTGSNTSFSNRYILVNSTTSLIAYTSSSASFSSVAAGTYQLYAVNYDPSGTAPTLTVGTNLNAIGGSCVSLSTATTVTVNAAVDCTTNRPATPAITNSNITGDILCLGSSASLTTNCASGTSVLWSTGYQGATLVVSATTATSTTYTAKCVSTTTGCESLSSTAKVIAWKALVPTIINVGTTKSGIKTGTNVSLTDWQSQFVTLDAGPLLTESTEANPTLFYTENTNKAAPRYWTTYVETCALGTSGSVSYDLLCNLETGGTQSFNTHENNAPYFMYANQGYTELYTLNHAAYGFYSKDASGNNTYDAGLPKGLYKLSVRYWDTKGVGLYPAVRTSAGNVVAYQEYWFRIQSQNGINTGAARLSTSIEESDVWAKVTPNPVQDQAEVYVLGHQNQNVKVRLLEMSGRENWQRTLVPETNNHRETFNLQGLASGVYFLEITSDAKRRTLKIIKTSN